MHILSWHFSEKGCRWYLCLLLKTLVIKVIHIDMYIYNIYTCVSRTQSITWILSFTHLKISAAGGRLYLGSRFIDRYYFVFSSNNLNVCYRGG